MSKLHMLLALQTALLLFLGYRVMTLEGRTNELVIKAAAEIAAAQNGNSAATSTQYAGTNVASTANIASRAETRQIIREEIDGLSVRLLKALEQQRSNSGQPMPQQMRVMSSNETAKLTATINNQISTFSAQGNASQAEMAALEIMIAKLPPRERIKAMGQLNKAMNSGQLNTRF